MTEHSNKTHEETIEKKKIDLKEAVKQKLANQQKQSNQKMGGQSVASNKGLKSQISKRPNNQHRRTGV